MSPSGTLPPPLFYERTAVFHDPDDSTAFVALLRQACARLPMRVLAYGLMPNHFHLVRWPHRDGGLSACTGGLLTAHVRRHHIRYRTTGHFGQGRLKAFPIEQEVHLLTVVRHVERNPLRAGLVEGAEDWPWSSLRAWRDSPLLPLLDPGSVARPPDWLSYVRQALTEAELARPRLGVQRDSPYGTEPWVRHAAQALGLESSLRAAGRPAPGHLVRLIRRLRWITRGPSPGASSPAAATP